MSVPIEGALTKVNLKTSIIYAACDEDVKNCVQNVYLFILLIYIPLLEIYKCISKRVNVFTLRHMSQGLKKELENNKNFR